MKAWIEEYGQFLVAVIIGIALWGILYGSTVQNTELMTRLIPDERNMTLSFLKNTEIVDDSQIPKLGIVDTVTVFINPNNALDLDYMSPSIVRSVTDGEGHTITEANYIPMRYARDPSKLVKGKINIIGYDIVNTKTKGDYEVTYQFENPNTGYQNTHALKVLVRRPYIPHEYLRATGTQWIDTGVVPYSNSTVASIVYAPTSTSNRQDILWTEGDRMKFGIFIQNGKWGYAVNDSELLTNINATTARQTVTLDLANKRFEVGSAHIDLTGIEENVGNGYIQIFRPGQQSGKLYECQIYDGEELKRNFFPAYSKGTNSIGLWDSNTWSPFLNRGNAYPPFVYGKEMDD